MSRNFFFFAMIVCMVLFFPITLNQRAMVKADNLKYDYSEAIDNASGDAAKALLNPSSNDSHEILGYGDGEDDKVDFQEAPLNLKDGLDRFYRDLYINLDMEDDPSQQQALLNKIPIIVAAGYDGYYIHTWQETKVDGKLQVANDWTAKKKYSVFDSHYNIKISYTLNDYVYYDDLSTGQSYKGNRQDFAAKYPSYFNDEHFNTVRSQVINQLIQNDLESYTYNNNEIAKRYGWQLNFNTPLWGDRAITTVSFIAFVQGKLTIGAPDVYNAYGFGTAKIVHKKLIYGYVKNGLKMYSNEKGGSNLTVFVTAIEAAKAGYRPDPQYQ